MREYKRLSDGSITFCYDSPQVTPQVREIKAGTYSVFGYQRRQIILPNEIGDPNNFLPSGNEYIIVGASGYSDLPSLDALYAAGVGDKWYELVLRTLREVVAMIQLNGRIPYFVHGSANKGIDKAIIQVATEQKLPNLGVSCLDFITSVTDESTFKVLCFNSTEEYSKFYSGSLDIFLMINGRNQALRLDAAGIISSKRGSQIFPVDALGSAYDGPIRPFNESGGVEEAVRALLRKFSFGDNASLRRDLFPVPVDFDLVLERLKGEVDKYLINKICSEKLSSALKS